MDDAVRWLRLSYRASALADAAAGVECCRRDCSWQECGSTTFDRGRAGALRPARARR